VELPISQGGILLTGNPYPSAIDLNTFLLENTNTTGIAYFWDSNPVPSHYLQDYEGGYGAYSPVLGDEGYVPAVFKKYDNYGNTAEETGTTGNYYARRYSPIGQGFIVEGSGTGKIFFRNKYRVFKKENPAQSQFKSSLPTGNASLSIPAFRLNFEFSGKYTRQLLFALHPTATTGADRAMDAKNLSVLPDDAGWLIGYTEYLINVVPELTNDLPLLISSESEIDVAINLTDHKNFEAPVFLWDSNMDIYYNLKNQEITLKLPSGGSHEQFFITFNKKISVEEKEETPFPKEYKIFQNNPLHRAEIMSPPESSPE